MHLYIRPLPQDPGLIIKDVGDEVIVRFRNPAPKLLGAVINELVGARQALEDSWDEWYRIGQLELKIGIGKIVKDRNLQFTQEARAAIAQANMSDDGNPIFKARAPEDILGPDMNKIARICGACRPNQTLIDWDLLEAEGGPPQPGEAGREIRHDGHLIGRCVGPHALINLKGLGTGVDVGEFYTDDTAPKGVKYPFEALVLVETEAAAVSATLALDIEKLIESRGGIEIAYSRPTLGNRRIVVRTRAQSELEHRECMKALLKKFGSEVDMLHTHALWTDEEMARTLPGKVDGTLAGCYGWPDDEERRDRLTGAEALFLVLFSLPVGGIDQYEIFVRSLFREVEAVQLCEVGTLYGEWEAFAVLAIDTGMCVHTAIDSYLAEVIGSVKALKPPRWTMYPSVLNAG